MVDSVDEWDLRRDNPLCEITALGGLFHPSLEDQINMVNYRFSRLSKSAQHNGTACEKMESVGGVQYHVRPHRSVDESFCISKNVTRFLAKS